MLLSDADWTFNGVSCTDFATSPGVGSCEESWATGVDDSGATVTAYVACEVTCPLSATLTTRTCTTGTPTPSPPACEDDAAWTFNGVGCTDFVASPGVGSCEQSWATGVDDSGATVTAYVACEVSCPVSATDTSRTCTAASTPASTPSPTPSATRTCADTDADGVADSFDCAAEVNAIDAAPEGITCAAAEDPAACTAAECCTVAPDRTCADSMRVGTSASPTEWDCAASNDGIDATPGDIVCATGDSADLCSHTLCCTVQGAVRTCEDRDMDGVADATAFNCTGSIKSITPAPAQQPCVGEMCTESECCTVLDCGTFDCATDVNGIDAAPAGITCAADPCTATECCTVVTARTCADSTLVGTSADNVVYDCSAHEDAVAATGFITTNPSAVTCGADPCTPAECCTGSSPPPRTCGDTNADTVPDNHDCAAAANSLNAAPTDAACAGDICLDFECCTVPPALTCADTTFVGTSAPKVQYNCSGEVKDLSATPAAVECVGLSECTPAECCTVTPTLPAVAAGRAMVSSTITLSADFATVSQDLAAFKVTFKKGIALQLSARTLASASTQQDCATASGTWDEEGSTCKLAVTQDDVTITNIQAGSVIVAYGVQLIAAQVTAVVYGTMVGGAIGSYPVAQWGAMVVTADSCPGACDGIVYPATDPGCSCATALSKLLCPDACSRPRRHVCKDAGVVVLYGQACPPPPPPPPSDDFDNLMPWGGIVLVSICFCTAFGKFKQKQTSGKVEPENHDDDAKLVHEILFGKAKDKWDGASAAQGGIVPAGIHGGLNKVGNVTGNVLTGTRDLSFQAADAALTATGTVARGAANVAAPVAIAAVDTTVAVAQGVGKVAVMGGEVAVGGAKMALAGLSGTAMGTKRFANKLKFRAKQTKELEEQAPLEPEPEPEPASPQASFDVEGSFDDADLFGEDPAPLGDGPPDRGTGRMG